MSNPRKVTANPLGFYEVTSGTLAERTYRVTAWSTGQGANCECDGFRYRRQCAHVEAVRQFAAKVESSMTPEQLAARAFARAASR